MFSSAFLKMNLSNIIYLTIKLSHPLPYITYFKNPTKVYFNLFKNRSLNNKLKPNKHSKRSALTICTHTIHTDTRAKLEESYSGISGFYLQTPRWEKTLPTEITAAASTHKQQQQQQEQQKSKSKSYGSSIIKIPFYSPDRGCGCASGTYHRKTNPTSGSTKK